MALECPLGDLDVDAHVGRHDDGGQVSDAEKGGLLQSLSPIPLPPDLLLTTATNLREAIRPPSTHALHPPRQLPSGP